MLTPTLSSTKMLARNAGPTYDRSLYVLRRQDPSILSIRSRFAQARCELEGSVSMIGKLVIYDREAYPTRGFAILNDSPSRDILYIQNLCSEDDLAIDGQHIVVTSRPNSLAHRWSLFDEPQSFASFDALLDGSLTERLSVSLLVDDDDFFMLSCSLQSAIRESTFIPTGARKSLNRLLTPLSTLPRSITTFSSPSSPLESPASARFDIYERASPFASPSRSMTSSPFQGCVEPVEKVVWPHIEDRNPSIRDVSERHDESDSNRLALLQKVFGDV